MYPFRPPQRAFSIGPKRLRKTGKNSGKEHQKDKWFSRVYRRGFTNFLEAFEGHFPPLGKVYNGGNGKGVYTHLVASGIVSLHQTGNRTFRQMQNHSSSRDDQVACDNRLPVQCRCLQLVRHSTVMPIATQMSLPTYLLGPSLNLPNPCKRRHTTSVRWCYEQTTSELRINACSWLTSKSSVCERLSRALKVSFVVAPTWSSLTIWNTCTWRESLFIEWQLVVRDEQGSNVRVLSISVCLWL